MNKFKIFISFIFVLELMLILIANIAYYNQNTESNGKIYLVEAKRIVKEIEKQKLEPSEIESMNLDKYETILRIKEFVAGETAENNYLVEEIAGKLYRIEYLEERSSQLPIYVNVILVSIMIVSIIVLVYVHNKVLKPFSDMSNLTYELAKGNLSMPIKEEKSRLFGRFLWEMNMLREKLEDNKAKELEFQKERKTLILSLSHDIKTPLSSIELYSKALAEDLFDTQEKKDEALQGIAKNVKEIKGYVDEIVTASREDFLKLEVNMGEYYLSEVMSNIESYYKEKLSLIHTEFQMDEVPEALVMGDSDRLVEVLQNVIENAIKYGDGKRISISFGEEEDCKLIHIKNSGCKLKTDELPNLFDSFYRGSNSDKMKGSGLGLYICKTLMQKMDGGIYAEIDGDVFCMTVVVRKV